MIVFWPYSVRLVSLWIWSSGWNDEWSGRLPARGHFAWHLGSTVAGAAAGWFLGTTPEPSGADTGLAIFFGGLFGSGVPIWRAWHWLGPLRRTNPGRSRGGPLLEKTTDCGRLFHRALRINPRYARAAFERANLFLDRVRLGSNLGKAFSFPGSGLLIQCEQAALVDLTDAIRSDRAMPRLISVAEVSVARWPGEST